MPWRVETVMSQRKEFVTLAQSEGVNMSQLCRRMGISRKTGYKWLMRYLGAGDQGLHDWSKRPCQSPNRTSVNADEDLSENADGDLTHQVLVLAGSCSR